MLGLTLAFAEKTLTGLVFAALVVGLFSYYDQGLIFDTLLLISFFAIALVFRRNVDLLTISAIFVVERGLEELMWRFIDYTIWFKILTYLIFFLVPIFLANGPLRTFAASFVAIGAAIEVYWYLTGYLAPEVLWNYYILSVSIIVRRLLRMRVFWLIELNPKLNPKPLFLDSQMLVANAMFIGLQSLMIIEYWIRHLFGISEMLMVYTIFPHLAAVISLFMLYMIVIQSVHHLRELELNA